MQSKLLIFDMKFPFSTEHLSLQLQKSRKYHQFRHSGQSVTLPLKKSVSMLSISQRDIDG